MRLTAWILIVTVLIMFFALPMAMVGRVAETYTDNAAESLDYIDGQNNFVPGTESGASIGQKIYDAFGGSIKDY